MTPYPAYKDSGIEWIGEVPVGWEVVKLKYLTTKVGSGVTPKGGAAVYQQEGIPLIRSQNVHFDGLKLDDVAYISEEIHENMKTSRVHPSDVLLNITGASIGRCCIVPANIVDANVNQHVCVVRPNKRIRSKFLHAYLASDKGQTQIFSGEKGISREGLNFEELKSFDVILPPLPEQTAIAAYLDRKTAQIDTLIERKRRLITLLQEERTAVISQAVTKGLNPAAPMKDSGIEWIGEVPAGWEIAKLKSLSHRIGDGIHATPNYVDLSDYWFINGNNLFNGSISINSFTRCVSQEEYEKYNLGLDENTVLLSINGTVGNVAFYDYEPVILGKSAAFIVCKNRLSKKFLFYWLHSNEIHNFYALEVTGTTIHNLSLNSVRNMPIPLPSNHEQTAIAAYLDKKTAQIDQSIARTERQIELLQEYRTALISAVVTGKVDVREGVVESQS